MRFIASFKDGVIASVEGVNTCFTYSGLIEGRLSGATRRYMHEIEERRALIEAGVLKGYYCFDPEMMDEKEYYGDVELPFKTEKCLKDNKVSAKNDNQKKQEKLEVGDILFARTGATVGKTLVYKKEFGECVFAGYLIRYRTNPNIVLPKFLFYFTHSTDYYEWVKINQAAAAQPNISAQKYNGLVINYPKDIAEQQTIVSTLDSLKSKVDRLQANYEKISAECDALKQAILRQVFE